MEVEKGESSELWRLSLKQGEKAGTDAHRLSSDLYTQAMVPPPLDHRFFFFKEHILLNIIWNV